MRILALHTCGGPVAEHRIYSPARALQRAGHDVVFYPHDENFAVALGAAKDGDAWQYRLLELERPDVIFSQYASHLPLLEAFAALREHWKCPLTTDLDDDVLNVPKYNKAFKSYHRASQRYRITLAHLHVSDSVCVSTPNLKKITQSHSRHTTTLPNYHDPDAWSGAPSPRRDRDTSIHFVFSCGENHMQDLEVVREAFEWAIPRFPQLRLIFVGYIPPWAAPWISDRRDPRANRAFGVTPAGISTYRRILRWLRPDVFVAPIDPNEFNRSKSCIKAYDAAESGGAFLCSDYDTYADVPTTTAIKVNGTYEWKEAIEHLIRDAAMRKRLNGRLLEWSRTDRHIDNNIMKWVNFFRETIERGPARSIDDLVRPEVPDAIQPHPSRRQVRADR